MSELIFESNKIRNIAIIAHVDHGKTTLVDAFLKQSNLFRDSQQEMQQTQILDSSDLEREKGITIKAKNVSIKYKDYKINIIDTPGHSDFGGEVERTLNMADGCLLLVDAQEGPMPQTKFVLRKALEMHLRPIVVINKIDKQFAEPDRVLDKISDLFLELVEHEEQLDFPVFYAIAREGKVFSKIPTAEEILLAKSDISPIIDSIIQNVPAPVGSTDEPFQMQITSIDFNSHLGKYLIGKIERGKAQLGVNLVLCNETNANLATGKVKSLCIRTGLEFKDVAYANVGEIVAISGFENAEIGATLCDPIKVEALPSIKISPPSVKIKFEPNTSPFLGREGDFVNYKQLQQRLEKESHNNVSMDIKQADGGYYVAGRGELQLAILIETMRREGYEFQVRKPEVILKKIDDKLFQPKEELMISVPEEYQTTVTKVLLERKADILNIDQNRGYARFDAHILTTKLFGLRNQLVTLTKNQAVVSSEIIDYVPYHKNEESYRNGVLISMAQGKAVGYSLNTIQERGELFVEPGEEVYAGMILGINKYDKDMEVNPTKERQKSGVRVKHDEITQTVLKPKKELTLEFALVFLNKDEILEITPKNLRLRKEFLTKTERDRHRRSSLTA